MTELLIAVVVYNQPTFLEYQYKCLSRFIKQPFRLLVFDNSDASPITDQFLTICNTQKIEYIRVPQSIHSYADASSRAGMSLDYSLRYIYNDMQYRGIVMVNDSDLFLIREYNPLQKIKNVGIIGRSIRNIYQMAESKEHPINRFNIDYYTNQFLIIDYSIIDVRHISFIPTIMNGIHLDCGGQLYEYFHTNSINHTSVYDFCSQHTLSDIMNYSDIDTLTQNYLVKDADIHENRRNFSEIFDHAFLHLRAGSNWIGQHNDIWSKRWVNFLDLFYKLNI